jgi:hypothetical protein
MTGNLIYQYDYVFWTVIGRYADTMHEPLDPAEGTVSLYLNTGLRLHQREWRPTFMHCWPLHFIDVSFSVDVFLNLRVKFHSCFI